MAAMKGMAIGGPAGYGAVNATSGVPFYGQQNKAPPVGAGAFGGFGQNPSSVGGGGFTYGMAAQGGNLFGQPVAGGNTLF